MPDDDDQRFKNYKDCGELKPLSEFYRAEGCVDGRRGDCRSCFQAKAKRRADADPTRREIARQRTAKWIQDNEERYRARKREYGKTERYREVLRRCHLKTKYGITISDYEAMLAEQGGGCAICGAPEPEGGSLHVDHDHGTGVVRGLLCFPCNSALGRFRDNVAAMRRAIDYLDCGDRDEWARARADERTALARAFALAAA